MNVLVVLAHPREGSFNHALAAAAVEALEANGHRVVYHDLCREGFDPGLPAGELPRDGLLGAAVSWYCQELAAAEGIVIVHPNWWGQPPAVLKGWVDRVFRPGVAYEFLEGDSGGGVPRGLLRARTAVVLNTTNTAPRREQEVFGDPLEHIWKRCVFGLCGVRDVRRRVFGIVVTSTAAEREAWLAEARELVDRAYPRPGEGP